MTILLDNVMTDTVSDIVTFRGGPAVIYVRGDDYDGGTVEIEIATVDDSEQRFAAITDGSFTADGTVKIDYLANGSQLRASLTGATSPINIFVSVSQ